MRNAARLSWFVVAIIAIAGIAAAQSVSNGLNKPKVIDSLLQQNKMTLPKAIAIAERVSKGRALQAVSDVDQQGRLLVHVHCLAKDEIVYVQVDGVTGKPISTAQVDDLDQRPAAAGTNAPGKQASQPSAIPTITLAELEFKGKDYFDKRVRILGCSFQGGSGNQSKYTLYLGQERHNYSGIHVDKDQMADVLVELKQGMTVNVEGVVKWDENRQRPILACDKVEIVTKP